MNENNETNKLKISDENSFVNHLKSENNKPSTTINFYHHGEFYTVHGKDAYFGANQLFQTSSAVVKIGKEGSEVETLFLRTKEFVLLCRDLLLVLQYRVEIHERNNGRWSPNFKASPGNLIEVEDLIFKDVDLFSRSSLVMAVKFKVEEGKPRVGVACVDASLLEILHSEFEDNENFSNLESLVVQLGPKECLAPKLDSSHASEQLRDLLKRSGVLLSERPKQEFTSKNVEQDLSRLVKKGKRGEIFSWLSDRELASCCLSSLIGHARLLSDEDNFEQFRITEHNLRQFMRLDVSAYSALNLFPERSSLVAADNDSADSLFGVLNHCQTQQGERMLARWIKQPLVDLRHLEERLSLVEALVDTTELRQSLSEELLRKMPDFERLSQKFQRKKASLQDCFKVYQSLKHLPNICEAIEKNSTEVLRKVFTVPLHEIISEFDNFLQMMDTTLDFDMLEKHEFLVKCDFDPELQRLRAKMSGVEDRMQACFLEAAQDLGLEAGKNIKLEQSPFGFVFRISCKDEKSLRNNKKYRHLDTNKAGVRFSTSEVEDLNSDLSDCTRNYEQQQDAVVTEIVAIAAGYVESMRLLGALVAKLDVLVSFARASLSAPEPYVRPELLAPGSRGTVLEQCRHPCVERGTSFIPNDLRLQEENFVVVTGPNMGGKSTLIRQVGLCVLMAQIGCFVPCHSATISAVDAILARVGAGDSQGEGVSTFMAEMLEAASILRSATSHSLVIVDELGRGTSTYDGFGLAWAISRHITLNLKAACLFATHFHEMTSLANEVTSAVNYHVTALTEKRDDGEVNLTMLYQLRPGCCDRSFGIHVAECVGFPRHVIKSAKRKADELEHYFVTSQEESDEFEKRRKIKKEGEIKIRKFIDDVKSLDWNGMSRDERLGKFRDLKSEVLAPKNLYVASVVESVEA